MYYSILCRWGPEWGGQSVIYTKSKALFVALTKGEDLHYNDGFSEELKQEIRDAHNIIDWVMPNAPEPIDEDMDLCNAIEYLETSSIKYPITVIGHTEFTPYWNY